MADIVVRNGHVIDPANQLNLVCDVAFKDGKISAIGKNLPKAREEVDASGCLVVPGLIDLHTHVYEHATTLGVNPDETCLARGNDNNRINFTSLFLLIQQKESPLWLTEEAPEQWHSKDSRNS